MWEMIVGVVVVAAGREKICLAHLVTLVSEIRS